MKNTLFSLSALFLLTACGGSGVGSSTSNPPIVQNADSDSDGVLDSIDNCVNIYNPGQEDKDGDLLGDACDPAVAYKIPSPEGDIKNGRYSQFDLSEDGRFVAFVYSSQELNLEDKTSSNIYLYDIENETTTLVSSTAAGNIPNDLSDNVLISKDGRFVYYETLASNIAGGEKETGKLVRFDSQTHLNELIPYDYDVNEIYGLQALTLAKVSQDGYKLCLNSYVRDNSRIMTDKLVFDTNNLSFNRQRFYGECGEFVNSGNTLLLTSSNDSLVYDWGYNAVNNPANVYSVDLTTGKSTKLLEPSLFEGITEPYVVFGGSSQDGNFVTVSIAPNNVFNRSKLFLIDKLDDTVTLLVNGNETKYGFDAHWSRVSEDGKYVYFSAIGDNFDLNSNKFERVIVKLEVETNKATLLFEDTKFSLSISNFDISRDGKRAVGNDSHLNTELVVLTLNSESEAN